MNRTVVLKQEYKGLQKGTELVYNESTNSWSWEISEEDISDWIIKNYKAKIQFSDQFVRDNSEVFQMPN